MITIGRYLIYIIYLKGLTLSIEGVIREKDINMFLDDIYNLHNKYRLYHRVQELKRTPQLDSEAAQLLNDMLTGQYNPDYDVYGKNILEEKYYRYTTLNTDEANRTFLRWYEQAKKYNFFFEPSDHETCKEFTQIVWKDTEWFGIAMTWTNEKYVVQMIYYPSGNIPGQFKNNILHRPIIAFVNSSFFNRYIFDNVKNQFEDYIVHLHNEARIKHRVPILKRVKRLDDFANHILVMSSNKYYKYGMDGKNYLKRKYNDNTLLDEAEAEAIFLEWYNKGKDYNYSVEPSNNQAAEFTQIVWMSTEKIGISILKEEEVYRILAYYDSPGNIEGKFISNVLMPRSMEQGESSSYIDN